MPGQNHVRLIICENAQDAIDKGYVYREPDYKGAVLETIVVVRGGMESGKSSVDLVFKDESGQRHVALLPTTLLKMIPD